MTRQVNIIKSLLSNWSEYEELATKADDSAGTTLENQNKYAESLKGKLAELSTTWDSIKDGVINSELLNSLVNMSTGVSKLIDQFGLLKTAVLAFTTVSAVRNGGIINTWYKDLMKVQTVLNSMKNIEIWNIGSGALAPATVTSLSTAISGLSKEQAILALSTKGITGARAEQVLVDAGMIASTESINASLMRNALLTTNLDTVEQKAIMTKLGLTTATSTCTKAKFDEVIANTTLSASEKNAIASQLGLTTTNVGTTASVNLLTASIWANIKAMAMWMVSNPVGWVLAAGIAVFGLSKLYKSNTEKLQENQEALAKQKGEYDTVTTKVTSLETELKACQDRLEELNSLGGANVVKDGEQAKLEAQTAELQRQLDIEKEAQRIAGLKAEKTAVKTLDTKNRMKYGIDREGRTDNTFKPVTMGEELAITMSEYDKVLKKYKELETEQQKLAKDKKGNSSQFKVNESDLANLSDKMTEFESYASELATGVQTASDSINGATGEVGEKAKAEATSVIDSYNLWTKSLDSVSTAETELADATTQANTTITNAFSFADSKDGIDAYQSSISTLSDALSAISDGSFSSSDLVDLLQQFPELEGKTDNLSASIKTLAQDSLKTLLSQLGTSVPQELKDSLISMVDSMGSVAESANSMSDAISSVNKVKDGLKALDSAMAKIKSDSEELNFDDIVSLQEQFGNLDGFDDFISTITNSASTAEETQQAFNNLTSEYVNQSGALDNLNFATADLVAQQLRGMGIANAEEVVFARLGVSAEQYARVKQYCTQTGIDLTNMTYQEIQALINETGITQQAAQQMYIFALKKALANQNPLNTSADIQNLRNLVSALGGTTTAIDLYNQMKSNLNTSLPGVMQNSLKGATDTAKQKALDDAKNTLNSAMSSANAISDIANNMNFQGGANTADALAKNLDNAKDSAKEAEDAFKSAYDAYMKLMNHKQAMGIYDDDPMEYVKDLQTLVNDYVYDQDTAWEAEEKIYEARQKYMDDWISKAQEVYSSYIDMLGTLQEQLSTKFDLNDSMGKGDFKKYLQTFKDEAKAYADARNYMQKQLKEYLKSGGKKGDDRWKELTNSIAEANSAIDETKLSLKELIEGYTDDWGKAIEGVYEAQTSSLEKYQERLESLYNLTGDNKFKDDSLKNYLNTLSTYETKFATQQKAINDGLANGTISSNQNDGYKYDKFLELQEILDATNDSINDLKVNIKDFADNAISDWIDSVDNLGKSALDSLDAYQSELESYISLLEANGEVIGDALYQESIDRATKSISVYMTKLEQARINLQKGLDNGTIVEGDEAWENLITSINEANEGIVQGKTDIVEYNNAIMKLDWSKFDDLKEIFDSISDEIGNVISTIDDADLDLVNDDASLSKDGLATLALQLQQREASIYALQQVKAEIASLNSDYASGTNGMSETEYAERLAELKGQQYDLVEKIQSAEQSVLDIYEEQKEAQIQLIQDKIDALQEENDERQRALDLQKAQYALEQAMNNRNKMTFTGKEFEYTVDQSEVDDARSNLSDLELQSQVADLEKQIKALEAQVPVLSKILDDAINLVNDNATEVYETLMEYSEKYGITISDYIITAWNGVIDSETGATNALTQFGITVTNTSSKSVSALHKVKVKIEEIRVTSNTTAQQIVTMLTPDTQYIETKLILINNDIIAISNSAYTANLAVTAWNNISLATFNQTTAVASSGVADITTKANIANSALKALDNINVYTDGKLTSNSIKALKSDTKDAKENIEGIKSALDRLNNTNVTAKATVTYKGKSASEFSAIANAINSLQSRTVTVTTIHRDVTETASERYRAKNTVTGATHEVESNSKSDVQAWIGIQPIALREQWILETFAKGGIVGLNGKSPLDQLAQSAGEDHMVAVKKGEGVLTSKETKGYQDFAGMTPDLVNTFKPLVDLGKLDISNLVTNKTSPSYSPSFTIAEGAITLQNVNDVDGLSTAIVRELPQAMLQQMYKR